MNCKQANDQSITAYLSSIGIDSSNRIGNELFYFSPLRDEKTPSFTVNAAKNVWKDHGTGEGGRLIDLIMQLHGTDVAGALTILNKKYPQDSIFSSPAKTTLSSSISIRKVKQIETIGLINYLKNRAIPLNTASNYLQEAYYTTVANDHKQYYALCFQNDKGGYELRSKVGERDYKFSTSPKYITTVPGNNESAVNIFEGFFDFLSALTYFKRNAFKCTTIILNSLVHLPMICDNINQFPQVNAFLDNDSAGNKALIDLTQIHPSVINQAHYYNGYKDFNEFLQVNYPLS